MTSSEAKLQKVVYGVFDDSFVRVLPDLPCPLCGNNLKELRVRVPYLGKVVSWVCDCPSFVRLTGE